MAAYRKPIDLVDDETVASIPKKQTGSRASPSGLSEEWAVRLAPLKGLLETLRVAFRVGVVLPTGTHVWVGNEKALALSSKKLFTDTFREFDDVHQVAGVEYLSDVFWLEVGSLKMGDYHSPAVRKGELVPLVDTTTVADIIGLENIEAFVKKNWHRLEQVRAEKIEKLTKDLRRTDLSEKSREAMRIRLRKYENRIDTPDIFLTFHLKTNLHNMFVLTRTAEGAVQQVSVPRFAMNLKDARVGFQLLFESDLAADMKFAPYTRVKEVVDGEVRFVFQKKDGGAIDADVVLWHDPKNQTYAALLFEGQALEDVLRLDEKAEKYKLVGNRVVKVSDCVGCAADIRASRARRVADPDLEEYSAELSDE